jgi:glycosyltransferase involved in cell wall biosynthesis
MNVYEKYSFLMSVYAKEKYEYLKLALNSMLNQTIKPDEIVIVKDGLLTDELEHVIKDYKEKYPNIFTIISNDKNLGLGLSLNKGLAVCKNELVARMDSDDICYPERCEKEIEAFKNDSKLSIVGAYISEFSETPDNVVSIRKVPLKQNEIYEFAKRRSAFNHPVVMFKKSKVLELGGYSSLRRNQDVDLFGRMLFAGCKALNISEPLLYFRSNNDLAKRRKGWENSRSYIGVIYKQYKSGYSSLFDFLTVAVAQIVMFLMPLTIQHFLYKHFLRK